MVLVVTMCVVACAGYGRIKPGQGIGAVGALASRGSHVSAAEQGSGNARKSPSGAEKPGQSGGHTFSRDGPWHPEY
jgi:hypothetical protein